MLKKNILVLCGGQSTEHDISLLSAHNVVMYLDKTKYTVSVVKITHAGIWQYYPDFQAFLSHTETDFQLTLCPGQKNPFYLNQQPLNVDCVFPVLHGTNGEDGTVQGLLELLGVPYAGADCLSSAIGMDKEILKRLLEAAGLPVVARCLVRKQEKHLVTYADITQKLGSTVFVKPNSLGSAVGVQKAINEKTFFEALENAFQYDEFVLVEKGLIAREIECSVLGNEYPKVSLPGEIVKHTDFYSFDAKYVDAEAATVQTPATLSDELIEKFQSLALKTYKVLRTVGMARVDFFLSQEGDIYVNEINTIPGFTNISMYPKNWEASGLPYPKLLDELITLGIERYQFKKGLNRIFESTHTVSA